MYPIGGGVAQMWRFYFVPELQSRRMVFYLLWNLPVLSCGCVLDYVGAPYEHCGDVLQMAEALALPTSNLWRGNSSSAVSIFLLMKMKAVQSHLTPLDSMLVA